MTNSNIEIIRGDDKVWILTVTRKDTGAAVDITGTELTFTARASPDAAVFLTKTSNPAAGITLTTPLAGQAEIVFDVANTSSLSNEKHEYLFDVSIKKVTGKYETICKGKLTVLPDITHA